MKKIKLTQNKYAIVDNSDYEWLTKWRWGVRKCGSNDYFYAIRGFKDKQSSKVKAIRMHRLILNASENMQVDHINGNTLDNRKSNLRIVTHGQNKINQRMYKNNTSGKTGVYWIELFKKYQARIHFNNKNISLGYFTDFNQAVARREEAEKRYFGEFRHGKNTA